MARATPIHLRPNASPDQCGLKRRVAEHLKCHRWLPVGQLFGDLATGSHYGDGQVTRHPNPGNRWIGQLQRHAIMISCKKMSKYGQRSLPRLKLNRPQKGAVLSVSMNSLTLVLERDGYKSASMPIGAQ